MIYCVFSLVPICSYVYVRDRPRLVLVSFAYVRAASSYVYVMSCADEYMKVYISFVKEFGCYPCGEICARAQPDQSAVCWHDWTYVNSSSLAPRALRSTVRAATDHTLGALAGGIPDKIQCLYLTKSIQHEREQIVIERTSESHF